MPIDPSSEVEVIISELDEVEIRVMRFLGAEEISIHKNIRKVTIKDRLPNKYGKKVDNAIDSLLAKGLMFTYRHKNYGLSSLGLKLRDKL